MTKRQTTKSKPGTKKLYRITLICKNGNNTLVTAEKVSGPSFKCPLCRKTLVYLAAEHRISYHGAPKGGSDPKAPLSDHELRKVTEVSQVQG